MEKKQLNDKETDIVQGLGMLKLLSLVRKIQKVACRKCLTLAAENTRRPIEDYCQNCQKKFGTILGQYAKVK